MWPMTVPRRHSHKGVAMLCPPGEGLLNPGIKAHKEDVDVVGKFDSPASTSCTTMRVILTP